MRTWMFLPTLISQWLRCEEKLYFFYLIFIFLLKYIWFTISHMYSKVIQLHVYIHTHVYFFSDSSEKPYFFIASQVGDFSFIKLQLN